MIYLKYMFHPGRALPLLAILLIAWVFSAPIDGQSGAGIQRFIGRFHILFLHFPICLLLLAPLCELLCFYKKYQALKKIIPLIWGMGAVSAVITAGLGVLLAANEGLRYEEVQLHLQGGVSVALLALLCTGLSIQTNKITARWFSSIYAGTTCVLILVLMLAAHAGGSLVHGEAYLTRYAPTVFKAESIQSEDVLATVTVKHDYFTQEVRPVFEQYCFSCHGDEKQKGNVQLDILSPDFISGGDAEHWHAALDMINSGEMPPKKKAQPSNEQRRVMVDWITNGIQQAKEAKRNKSAEVIRRLTKQQYTNSLKDLLGIDIDFGEPLPDDPLSEMGFSNNAELLSTSTLHLEYFQTIARSALDKAINVGDKPKVHHYRMYFGKGAGRGQPYTLSRGYMDVPLATQDFNVKTVLDTNNEQALNKDLKKYFSASLRGSKRDRFQLQEQGLTFLSSMPHKEYIVAGQYGAWNAPSPNVAMQIKDQFPTEGEFVVRVSASKGQVFKQAKHKLDLYNKSLPLNTLNKKFKPVLIKGKTRRSIIASEETIKKQGLEKDKKYPRMLVASPSANHATAELKLKLQDTSENYYQIELVHLEVSDGAMATVEIKIDKELIIDVPIQPTGRAKVGEPVISTVGIAYLSGRAHQVILSADGNFPGFSDVVFTKVLPESKIAKSMNHNYGRFKGDITKTPELTLYLGTRTDDGVDYKQAPSSYSVKNNYGDEKVYSFKDRLENYPVPTHATQGDHISSGSLKVGVWNNHLVKNAKHDGSLLHINYIEFEAPYITQWPSASHKAIFIESKNSEKNAEYAEEIIQNFASRAFRRKVTKEEIKPYMALWQSIKGDYTSFEGGIKETLVAVLSSSNFLYLPEPETQDEVIDDYALASRLSYFLWDSPPDNELLALAERGELKMYLGQQTQRLMADKKIERFVRVFASEWLRLDRHENQNVDVTSFPEFTRFVKKDMLIETKTFIKTMIELDLSVLNLIESDFTMLNQNLAEFYGIKDINGSWFRPVVLDDDQPRGGLLAQGAFLTGHADGVHSHPVKRAVWLKEKILGEFPPPPPPNVPDLNPDTPGFENLTLKQQLELHRDKESCRDCHAKIDPYGIVFENYDAVGRYRESYKGAAVDSLSTLPDGTEIKGMAQMKQYLLSEKPDAVVTAFIKYVYSYALGREVTFHDDDNIANILSEVKASDYSMQSVFTAIIESPAFSGAKKNHKNSIRINEDSPKFIQANKNTQQGVSS